MSRRITIVLTTSEADDERIIRSLKALLKRLVRNLGLRCKKIEIEREEK